MKRVLGRKQNTDNSRWLDAVAHIEEWVTREELAETVATTHNEIKEIISGKRVAFAWSGGKDSLVLADLCAKLGMTDCLFAHTDLEYPAFLAWCLKHKSESCEVINTGQDLDWLSKHSAMIFPANSAIVSRWFAIVQRAAIQKYFTAHHLDIILTGHRKADGNYVGRGTNIYTNGAGVTRYSPLADWPHELILAYIHYHNIPMPPIYGWKDGYRCGTHPWPSRMGMKSVDDGWADVYAIDPSIVTQAAKKIESAARFLEGVGV